MGRKIFISTLGTNNYSKLSYYTKEYTSDPVRFIQVAELNRLKVKDNWAKNDKVIVLLTDEARKKNWFDDGQVDRDTKKIIKQEGLESQIRALDLPCKEKGISIKDGNTTEEIWDIFSTVYKLLEEGDELYFDITHGFRYLPMLILVLGNYSRFLKKTSIKSITYGNFEARLEGKGPIVDLLPFISLQEWTSASATFLETGHVGELTRLSDEEIIPLFKDKGTDKKSIGSQRIFANKIDNIVDRLIACRGIETTKGSDIELMNKHYELIKDPVLEPMGPIFDKLHESMSGFTNESSENNFVAAEWCFNRKLYQQSYTFLEEGITTLFCMRNSLNWETTFDRSVVLGAAHGYTGLNKIGGYFERDQDKYLEKELNSKSNKTKKKRTQEEKDLSVCRNSINVQLCMLDKIFRSSYNLIESIKQIRNDYNHAGFRGKECLNISTIHDRIKFEENIKSVKDIPCSIGNDKTETYFVNFSNHQISDWSKDQLAAAEEYGSIIDMPFPNINSEGESDYIDNLVKSYQEIFKIIERRANIVVHIMGEQTFSYRTIVELKSRGIKCLASTTKRITSEDSGIKTSVFGFKNYREY